MIASIALTLALIGQPAPQAAKAPSSPTSYSSTRPITSPSDPVKPPGLSQRRWEEAQAQATSPNKPPGMSQRRWEEIQATTAKKRAFKSARTRAGRAREARWAAEEKAAIAKAERDYKAALPYLLENQRQQLERLSAHERNMALQKMAQSSAKIANAIQYQSVYRPYTGR